MTQKLMFTKMHGCGNDYIYINMMEEKIADPQAAAIALSDRHKGIGSDGLVLIGASTVPEADYSMHIYNADGSEAMMCGNGIRCVGKYVYDKGYTDDTHLRIETLSGIKELELTVAHGKVQRVTVQMGKASVRAEESLRIAAQELRYIPVSVGNPHAVFFTENAEAVPLETWGPQIEHHPDFPDGVNAEFVQVLSDTELRMRVWERGSGVTMACGTGSCASAAAAVRKGYCRQGEPIAVHLDGGTLYIQADADGTVTMTGPAEIVYEGETV